MSARSSATAPRSIIKSRPETAMPYENVSVTNAAALQRSESERVRAPAAAMQLVDCTNLLMTDEKILLCILFYT